MIDHVLQREVIVHSRSDSETLGLRIASFIGYEEKVYSKLECLSSKERHTRLARSTAGVLPTNWLVGLRLADGLVWHGGHALLYCPPLIHYASIPERRNPTRLHKFVDWTRTRQHPRVYWAGELRG